MTRGILYVATGDDFVEEAEYSARSAKDVMPDIPITLITDQIVDVDVFDTVLEFDNPRHDGGDRVTQMLQTPYNRTLFIDTDIYFAESVYELFDLLDNFDIGVATNGQFFEALEHHGDTIPEAFPEFNGGVLVYEDNPNVRDFQQDWEATFFTDADDEITYNQPSLRKTLYESDVRYTVLPRRYNCIFRRPGQVHNKVKLFHGRLRDLDSYGADSSIDVETAIEAINNSSRNRVYYQSGSKIKTRPSVVERVWNSLYYTGVCETLSKIAKELRNK